MSSFWRESLGLPTLDDGCLRNRLEPPCSGNQGHITFESVGGAVGIFVWKGPLKQQVEQWRAMQLSTAAAKLLIYQAFIEEESGFPKHLARRVHKLYFQPVHEEFQPRTMWSLSNAFTSAFKELEPIPQYKATAKLAEFLQAVRSF